MSRDFELESLTCSESHPHSRSTSTVDTASRVTLSICSGHFNPLPASLNLILISTIQAASFKTPSKNDGSVHFRVLLLLLSSLSLSLLLLLLLLLLAVLYEVGQSFMAIGLPINNL
jgi:hypothetical protein